MALAGAASEVSAATEAPSLMQGTFSPLGLPDVWHGGYFLPSLPSYLGASGMIRSPLGKSFPHSELGPCISNRGCGSASSCS